jgi:hypothetical protein
MASPRDSYKNPKTADRAGYKHSSDINPGDRYAGVARGVFRLSDHRNFIALLGIFQIKYIPTEWQEQ